MDGVDSSVTAVLVDAKLKMPCFTCPHAAELGQRFGTSPTSVIHPGTKGYLHQAHPIPIPPGMQQRQVRRIAATLTNPYTYETAKPREEEELEVDKTPILHTA
jgi:hypothetical protein